MGILPHFCPKSGCKTRSLPHISADHGLVGSYPYRWLDATRKLLKGYRRPQSVRRNSQN